MNGGAPVPRLQLGPIAPLSQTTIADPSPVPRLDRQHAPGKACPTRPESESSVDHEEVGKQGIGLCSFTVGLAPEELGKNLARYRAGLAQCAQPVGKFLNDTAATFTMVHCAPTKEEAYTVAKESFEWYPATGARIVASVAEWLEGGDLGTYQYAAVA